MTKYIFFALASLALASCSAPQYTYNFDHYNYQAGKKTRSNRLTPDRPESPLFVQSETVTADLSPSVSMPSTPRPSASLQQQRDHFDKLSAVEKKAIRSAVKKELKRAVKKMKAGDEGARVAATQELDDELKLAIIFGAIGITLTVLGGISAVFWILGVIGLAVGLVFFIRWISRQ